MSLITGLLAKAEAKKTRKAQEAANEAAETKAKEAAALDETKEDTGADIIFGSVKGGDTLLKRNAKKRASVTGASGAFGGLGSGKGLTL